MSSFRYKRKSGLKGVIIVIIIIAIIVSVATYYYMQNESVPPEPSYSGNVITPIANSGDTGLKINPKTDDIQVTPANISSYDGFWVDLIMGGSKNSGEDLWVYYKNDKVDIDFIEEKNNVYYEVNDIEFSNNIGSFKTSDKKYSGTIELKKDLIELKYTNNSDNSSYEFLFQKASKITLSRQELFDEINYIIKGNYEEIDYRIFKVRDGKEFMSLELTNTCFVDNRDVRSPYGGIDYLRDVYTIDKTKNKLITISEIIEDEEHARRVDDFITSKISDMIVRAESSGESWPYPQFMGVLSPYNDTSKYFSIDEDEQIINIKVFDAVSINEIDSGDFWFSVPFIYAFKDERLIEMGIEPMIIEEDISGDVSGDNSGDISEIE